MYLSIEAMHSSCVGHELKSVLRNKSAKSEHNFRSEYNKQYRKRTKKIGSMKTIEKDKDRNSNTKINRRVTKEFMRLK